MAEEHIEVFREQVKKFLDAAREINFNCNRKKKLFSLAIKEKV